MNLALDDRFETMPWDAVDNVVFDVGNVLLSFSPKQILEEYLPDSRNLYPQLMSKVFRSPYWAAMDHGSMSYAEIVQAMIGRDTELEAPIRVIMNRWVEMKEPIPEGIAVLNACREHGKRTFVLSNYGDRPFSVVENKYDFFRLFDGLVVSSRVGLTKPDPAIYHYLTDHWQLDPGRTLFIDDSNANIEVALHEGWQGICFNAPGRLRRFFNC